MASDTDALQFFEFRCDFYDYSNPNQNLRRYECERRKNVRRARCTHDWLQLLSAKPALR